MSCCVFMLGSRYRIINTTLPDSVHGLTTNTSLSDYTRQTRQQYDKNSVMARDKPSHHYTPYSPGAGQGC